MALIVDCYWVGAGPNLYESRCPYYSKRNIDWDISTMLRHGGLDFDGGSS